MTSINLSCPRWLWTILLVGVVGCSKSEPIDDRLAAADPAALVPVSGVVTLNGKPHATVVVTFLPAHGPALAVGTTDQDGKYVLESMGGPGALPGDYKIGISYLVSDKGEPQDIAARTALVLSPGMLSSKELVAKEYDLGRTKLTAKVGPQGGKFDFDVPAVIPVYEEKPAEKKAAVKEKSMEKKTLEKKSE